MLSTNGSPGVAALTNRGRGWHLTPCKVKCGSLRSITKELLGSVGWNLHNGRSHRRELVLEKG